LNAVLPTPSATLFDAITSLVSAALYIVVAAGALARAPRDPRVRVFALIAITAVAPYSFSALLWAKGGRALSMPIVMAVALSLAVGSIALFHFTQVFPWRRPWIARHRVWLVLAYAVLPIVTVALAVGLLEFQVAGVGAVSAGIAEAAAIAVLVFGLPAVTILGVVLPFAGLLSLFNSWKSATRAGVAGPRLTTLWILVSQLAGGVLTILIIPLLHLIAPRGPWVALAAALLFAFGLLMPLAFAAGVWRFNVLSIDPALPPPPLR
jgi:hypothetical protein